MKELEINLTFRKADFEELYFRNGNEKLFFSQTAKKQTLIFLAIGFLFLISLLYFILTNKSQEFVLFIFIVWILSGVSLGGKIFTILTWRKSIKVFLDKTSKYKTNKLILSENTLTIIQDNDETMEKWSEFKKVEINDESIRMYSEINYLFPSKSMLKEEYEMFKKIVREKIKNGL